MRLNFLGAGGPFISENPLDSALTHCGVRRDALFFHYLTVKPS